MDNTKIYAVANLTLIVRILKMTFIALCTYYTNFKINRKKQIKSITNIGAIILSIIIGSMTAKINIFILLLSTIISISFLFDSNNIVKSFLITLLSISINYVIFFITTIICFIINKIFNINNDILIFMFIVFIHLFIITNFFKLKKFKNGFNYFDIRIENNYVEIVALNISTSLLLSIIALIDYDITFTRNTFPITILIGIIMFVNIFKSIEAYYRQKLLIQDLNETKKELEDRKKEVEELEAENLRFSKKAHSLAHKQKSLEFKINKILMNSETAKEIGLGTELNNISKQLFENTKLPKLDKTGITEIDDMLNVMQEECRINGIDFVLQLKGNIYQMINHHISKEELAILLADHIKDGIIAINHSDNINRSIMVRLGKIDESFAIYFYDSGVEFPRKVFDNLGKKPVTMYPNEGGTGMGFMNTFDLLNKYNASLIVENIGKPCKDNYTKVIKIKFDNKKDLWFEDSMSNY